MISKTLRLISLIFLLMFASSNAFSNDKKVLIVGTSADYPPFEFIENEAIVGFDIDLANKIAAKLGYKLQVQNMKFASIISSLSTGRIDFAISGMNASPERRKNVDFSIDYYSPEYAMLYKKDSPVTSLKDLNGKIIAAQLGSTMEMLLNDEIKAGQSFKLLSLEKNTVMVEELKLGRINGVLVELAQAKAFVKRYSDMISYAPLKSKGYGYAIAFKKGSSLIHEFNNSIKSLKASGKLKKLEQKWFTK